MKIIIIYAGKNVASLRKSLPKSAFQSQAPLQLHRNFVLKTKTWEFPVFLIKIMF
jgi:hypothetical protein